MNKFRQFQRLVGTERRIYATVASINSSDRTTTLATPENRFYVAEGTGIAIGQKAFIVIPVGGRPRLAGPAPDLQYAEFENL